MVWLLLSLPFVLSMRWFFEQGPPAADAGHLDVAVDAQWYSLELAYGEPVDALLPLTVLIVAICYRVFPIRPIHVSLVAGLATLPEFATRLWQWTQWPVVSSLCSAHYRNCNAWLEPFAFTALHIAVWLGIVVTIAFFVRRGVLLSAMYASLLFAMTIGFNLKSPIFVGDISQYSVYAWSYHPRPPESRLIVVPSALPENKQRNSHAKFGLPRP